jgi:hypothetical protein
MAEETDVTIRIDKGLSAKLDDIVDQLEKLGLSRVERHERFMMINGCIDADKLDELRAVEGVESVRQDRTYRPQ